MNDTRSNAGYPAILAAFLCLGPAAARLQAQPAVELLPNGNFEGGSTACGNNDQCPVGWSLHETRDTEDSTLALVADNGPSAPGSTCIDFQRNADSATGDWTSIQLLPSLDVSCYSSLTLSMDVKVFDHSLEAGGSSTPAFEWPAEVLIDYRDANGAGQGFFHGFYVNPPGDGRIDDPGTGSHPIQFDEEVPSGSWVTRSLDLMTELHNPVLITRIRFGGSGWAYHGRIDNVSLLGQAAFGGNVNTAVGPPQDVLFVNGSTGGASRTVTIGTGQSVRVLFGASASGPLGANYVLYVYRGGQTNPMLLNTGTGILGCFVNPTPFAPAASPQPFRCLIGGLDPAFRGSVRQLPSPPSVPFEVRRMAGFPVPATFIVQGVVEDDGSTSPQGLSVTNATVIAIR